MLTLRSCQEHTVQTLLGETKVSAAVEKGCGEGGRHWHLAPSAASALPTSIPTFTVLLPSEDGAVLTEGREGEARGGVCAGRWELAVGQVCVTLKLTPPPAERSRNESADLL